MWRSLNPAATRLHKNLHRLIFQPLKYAFLSIAVFAISTITDSSVGIAPRILKNPSKVSVSNITS